MLCCRGNDHFQNAVSITQNIGIPEAKNPVALRLQPPIALGVALVLRVLPAVDFDDQMPFVTHEIDNEASDRCLPPEAKTVQAVSAQRRPEALLGVGHLTAERLGARTLKFRDRPMRG
jgi:hypothetical protein